MEPAIMNNTPTHTPHPEKARRIPEASDKKGRSIGAFIVVR